VSRAITSPLAARLPVGNPAKSNYTLGGATFNIATLLTGGEAADAAEGLGVVAPEADGAASRFAVDANGTLSTAPLPLRRSASGTWTGWELVVAGGFTPGPGGSAIPPRGRGRL
jgi:hypothetical protein